MAPFDAPLVPCAPLSLSLLPRSLQTSETGREMAPVAAAAAKSVCISVRARSLPLQVQAMAGISGIRSVSFTNQKRSFSSLQLKTAAPRFRVSCSAKPETVDKVVAIVKKQLALSDDAAVSGESKFSQLGADSLDTVEIVMGLEEEFGICVEEESAQSIVTVQDAADLIEKLVAKKSG